MSQWLTETQLQEPPVSADRTVAGIDVHRSIFVAVVVPQWISIETRSSRPDACRELVCRLAALGVREIAIESTGIYWIQLATMLEQAGINVVLANPQHLRAISGRKTDRVDAKRLALLMLNRSVPASFIASPEQREFRSLTRGRVGFVRTMVAHKNRAHKILRAAGVALDEVLDDIFCETGRPLLDALAAGIEPDMSEGALRRLRRVTREEVREVLGGCRLSKQSRFSLRHELAAIRATEATIEEFDQEIRAWLSAEGREEWKHAVALVDSIPGIGEVGATTLIAEIGVDLSRFATVALLASWAGLCPGSEISAGRNRNRRTPKGNPWIKRTLTESANSLYSRTKGRGALLGERLRRWHGKLGSGRAVIAMAHLLLRVAYALLQRNTVYDEQRHRQQMSGRRPA